KRGRRSAEVGRGRDVLERAFGAWPHGCLLAVGDGHLEDRKVEPRELECAARAATHTSRAGDTDAPREPSECAKLVRQLVAVGYYGDHEDPCRACPTGGPRGRVVRRLPVRG